MTNTSIRINFKSLWIAENPKNGIVEITIEAFNQHGDKVLIDTTEAIVKIKQV